LEAFSRAGREGVAFFAAVVYDGENVRAPRRAVPPRSLQ